MSTTPRGSACQEVREEISSLATPDDPELDIHKKYFPRSKVTQVLTRERVQHVLSCICASCKTRVENPKKSTSRTCDIILGQPEMPQSSLILLFALLIFVECPGLITGFLDTSYRDQHFYTNVAKLTDDTICHIFWPNYDSKERSTSRRLAGLFRWNRYRFFLPDLTDQSYSIFDKHTILPFFDERPIGKISENGDVQQEGAYGSVFAFKVLEEYRHLKSDNAIQVQCFARKELRGLAAERFQDERANLERVKKLNDPHIVKIITAYRHGNAFNMVFPLATTNLGQYIRDPCFQTIGASTDRCEMHPFWEEMLGLSKALCSINTAVLSDDGERPSYGYHLDLKPANILVQEYKHKATFVISDFGQATFKDIGRGAGTSQITGMGGTEIYAPPEINEPGAKVTRKYDVWSLGCIFLEICASMIYGQEGVHQLDKIRAGGFWDPRFRDERFWRETRSEGPARYELKPQISRWMDELPRSPGVSNANSQKFLLSVMLLVKQMLSTEVDRRPTSEIVYVTLSGLLKDFQPVLCSSIPERDVSADLPPDEVELGKDLLAQIGLLSCFELGHWYEGKLQIIENTSKALLIVASDGVNAKRLYLGPRIDISLLPCHRNKEETGIGCSTQSTITIRIEKGPGLPPRLVNIHSKEPNDLLVVQQVLLGQSFKRLGQKAMRTLPLRSASVQRRSGRMRSALHSARSSAMGHDFGRATGIQLWVEKSYRDPSAWTFKQRQDSPRTAPEHFFHGATPRRLVVYFQRGILMLRLASNVRVEKLPERSTSKSLKVIRTDKAKDSSFRASYITCKPFETAASIPIDRRRLDIEEEKGSFECQEVSFDFDSTDDLALFYKAYRAVKKEWHDEEAQIKELTKSMGEQLGWAFD